MLKKFAGTLAGYKSGILACYDYSISSVDFILLLIFIKSAIGEIMIFCFEIPDVT